MRDHPGGADVLLDIAGTDAIEAYEDVGHLEDADEVLETFLVGSVKGARPPDHQAEKDRPCDSTNTPGNKAYSKIVETLNWCHYIDSRVGWRSFPFDLHGLTRQPQVVGEACSASTNLVAERFPQGRLFRRLLRCIPYQRVLGWCCMC